MICELAEVAEGAAVSGTGVWAAAVMFFTIRMVQSSEGDLWDFAYLECAPAVGNSTQTEGQFFRGLPAKQTGDGRRG